MALEGGRTQHRHQVAGHIPARCSEVFVIMFEVPSHVLKEVVDNVVDTLSGISEIYPVQLQLLEALVKNNNVFFTSATNSGKTLPACLYPYVLEELAKLGYEVPTGKAIFITALNSIKLSMVSSVKQLGLNCEAVTVTNYMDVINSPSVKIIFVSPEVLKIPQVSACLLKNRHAFVLKIIDECHLGEFKQILLLIDLYLGIFLRLL